MIKMNWSKWGISYEKIKFYIDGDRDNSIYIDISKNMLKRYLENRHRNGLFVYKENAKEIMEFVRTHLNLGEKTHIDFYLNEKQNVLGE